MWLRPSVVTVEALELFPGLPELPPDLDSLAAALHLFARCAPVHYALFGTYPLGIAAGRHGSTGNMDPFALRPTLSALRHATRYHPLLGWGSGH